MHSINFTHKQCPICSVSNATEVVLFNEDEVRQFVTDVYNDSINIEHLDVRVYEITANEFAKYVEKGWGIAPNPLLNEKEYDIYFGLIESVYVFSAAKQYQCVREIQELKKDDDYELNAISIFNKYYIKYFSVELDMCDIQGGAVNKWLELENAEG